MDVEARRAEVQANYAAFVVALPELLSHCAGKFAVLRNRKIVEVFDNFATALAYCAQSFPDRLFSIQEIEADPLYFGAVTYAADKGTLRSNSRASD
jgi:hypothetical protein